MNILILTTHLNPGGISSYVINLVKGLGKQKHNIWVGCSGGEWVDKLKALGINYKFIPIKTKSLCSFKIFLSFLKLRQFIIREKIDIVHSNTRVTQYLGYLIYKRFGIPYISSFHGFYRPTIFRKLFRFAGLITIAVSEAVKNHLIKDLRMDADKIRVVYNGIDIDEFCKRDKRSDWGFKKSDYLIGILGRISQEKGHFLAIEAMSKLFPKYPHIYFLISGRGKMEKKLKLFIKAKDIEKRVKFLDCSSSQFLDIINLLLVPSKKEGFGYSIIEAFAKEVPVIGYNTGGIAEIIEHKRNGMLFYSYNSQALVEAIEEIIFKENLRKKIVAAAKEDVLFFSNQRMALDTEKVYQEVLK